MCQIRFRCNWPRMHFYDMLIGRYASILFFDPLKSQFFCSIDKHSQPRNSGQPWARLLSSLGFSSALDPDAVMPVSEEIYTKSKEWIGGRCDSTGWLAIFVFSSQFWQECWESVVTFLKNTSLSLSVVQNHTSLMTMIGNHGRFPSWKNHCSHSPLSKSIQTLLWQ